MKIEKIAVVATHSTGKTTFCKKLAERKGYNYIYDIVREEAVKKGFEINENTSPQVQSWLLARQWELEKTTPKTWIADKCLFDYSIYGNIVLKKEGISKCLLEVIDYFIDQDAKYDIVFYLPIEIPFERDGVRSDDLEFQRIVDDKYKEFLEKRGIKYFLISGSIEERIDQAIKRIEEIEKS